MILKEKLHENVYYYTDVYSHPEQLLEFIESLDSESAVYPVIEKWRQDNSERLVKNIFDWKLNEIPEEYRDSLQKVATIMQSGIEKVAKDFVRDKGLPLTPNVSKRLHFCKYQEGNRIRMHYDAQYNTASLYTLVVYWNNNYTGGEVAFEIGENKDIKFSVKPEPGSILVFPATEPYYHESIPLKTGYKYITSSIIYVEGFDENDGNQVQKYARK